MEDLMDKKYYSTSELEEYIQNRYFLIKDIAEKDNLYLPLDVLFTNTSLLSKVEGTHCYADEEGYHYVYSERGTVWKHEITYDLFAITYWVIQPNIFTMSCEYELNNRIDTQDSRRIIFQKELQFFEAMGQEYLNRILSEINCTLIKYPYHDKS